MKLTTSAAIFIAVCAAIPAAAHAAGSTPAAVGRARIVRPGNTLVEVALTVDVTSLQGGSNPVALGGYAIAVDFDPAALELVSVVGGTDPRFASTPFFTDPAKANATGHLRVVGVQTTDTAPMGEVGVARIRLFERRSGGAATVHIRLVDAASGPVAGADSHVTAMRLNVSPAPAEVAQ